MPSMARRGPHPAPSALVVAALCLCLCLAGVPPALPASAAPLSAATPAVALTVGSLEEPRGIAPVAPVWFGWQVGPAAYRGMVQASYRLTVAAVDNSDPARGRTTPVWDVNRTTPDTFAQPYAGPPLANDTEYRWSVAWADAQGRVAPAAWAAFTTGLPTGAFAEAWVGIPLNNDTRNRLRAELHTNTSTTPSTARVARATCFIAGLGYYTAHLNGERLDPDAELGQSPQWDKRVPFGVHDCTALLRAADAVGQPSVLAVELGRGWYSEDPTGIEPLGYEPVGPRRLSVRIHVHRTDGTRQVLGTGDAVWSLCQGPLVDDQLHKGVTYDARLEDPGWLRAGYQPAPGRCQTPAPSDPGPGAPTDRVLAPPIRKVETLAAVAVTTADAAAGVYTFDFGRNIAGWWAMRFDLPGPAGSNVSFVAGEIESAAGVVMPTTIHGQPTKTSYYTFGASTGAAPTFEPQFVYFGFRFVQVFGLRGGRPELSAMVAHVVHTDNPKRGYVRFGGDPLGNGTARNTTAAEAMMERIQAATVSSAAANFLSFPTDCPSREKRGWLGDGQITSITQALNFDMAAAYSKWRIDIHDAQHCTLRGNVPKGSVGDIAPHYFSRGACGGPGDPVWAFGEVAVSEVLLRHYGIAPTQAGYAASLLAYAKYMSGFADASGLMTVASYPSTRYGDWCAPNGSATGSIINSYFWIRQLDATAAFARLAGDNATAVEFEAMSTKARAGFNGRFYSPASFSYPPAYEPTHEATAHLSLQTSIALAFALGAVPEADRAKVAQTLVDDVRAHGWHVTSGLVGLRFVFQALSDTGFGEDAVRMFAQTTYPSFGYMMLNGEGTLWEQFHGSQHERFGSRNHIMLGSAMAWLYEGAAGVGLHRDARVAWDRIQLGPQVVTSELLTGASALVDTVRGPVSIAWQRSTNLVCGVGHEKDNLGTNMTLDCGPNTIQNITFASYGNPLAEDCGSYQAGACGSPNSMAVVTKACLHQHRCQVPALNAEFGGDPCPDQAKTLAVQATCSGGTSRVNMHFAVPPGSTADVLCASPAPGPLVVTDLDSGGAGAGGAVVWDGKAFHAVPGITAAQPTELGVMLTVASGSYRLLVASAA